jgi:hypothetical protein
MTPKEKLQKLMSDYSWSESGECYRPTNTETHKAFQEALHYINILEQMIPIEELRLLELRRKLGNVTIYKRNL